MIEPRHYVALTARARCEAGEFVLCGCILKPFSFRHSLQLEAAASPLWGGEGKATMAHYFEAAAICAHADFLALVPPVTAADFAAFDMDAANTIWRGYVAACYGSRPELWQSDAKPSHCRAPLEEFVATFILTNASGFTREQIFTAPVGEVMWIFESINEQIGDRSRILTVKDKADLAIKNTAAEDAARRRREANATAILKTPMRKADRNRLLSQAMAGTLPKDWRKSLRPARKGRRG